VELGDFVKVKQALDEAVVQAVRWEKGLSRGSRLPQRRTSTFFGATCFS